MDYTSIITILCQKKGKKENNFEEAKQRPDLMDDDHSVMGF